MALEVEKDLENVKNPLIEYQSLPQKAVTDEELALCAELFGNHYGVWAGTSKRVRLSAGKLRELLLFDSSTCLLVLAWRSSACTSSEAKVLVGQAFACQFEVPDRVGWWLR